MALHDKAINEFPPISRRAFGQDVGQETQPRSIPASQLFKPDDQLASMLAMLHDPSIMGGKMPTIRDFVHGMTDHFRFRATSWIMALTTMLYGVVLLQNPEAFDIPSRPYQYHYLLRIESQEFWGWTCIAVGVLRLLALVINGTFPIWKWSPHVRATLCFVTVFIWFQILFGSFHELKLNLSLPCYLAFFLLDVLNVYIATLEIDPSGN